MFPRASDSPAPHGDCVTPVLGDLEEPLPGAGPGHGLGLLGDDAGVAGGGPLPLPGAQAAAGEHGDPFTLQLNISLQPSETRKVYICDIFCWY